MTKLTNAVNLLVEQNKQYHKNNNIGNKYISVEDLQKLLKISKTQTYSLVNRLDFPKIKIGSTIRIPVDKLNEYMEHNLYKKIEIPK